ncbi:MAG: pyridoxamine 5'-phosphate oxidase family protein [Pseudomonadales bacterium]|nr:pyridoxamine 5'-phosphate oxidase family protein [Pseudomonadales bacterium]
MASKRGKIELSDSEIKSYLDSEKTMIIVSNGHNGFPHPMPMWFYVDDQGCLYCTTFRKSQKVANFKRDPKASLLIESGTEYAELKSVLIYATVEVIDNLEIVQDILKKITKKGLALESDKSNTAADGVLSTAPKRVLLKFVPEEYITWDHSKLGGVY